MYLGIDEADADLVIKPISDAPLPRKGPLPQDFQDALSIIFPGERKPVAPLPVEPPKPQVTESDISSGSTFTSDTTAALLQADQHNALLQQQLHEDQSEHSMDNVYSAFSVVNGVPVINQDLQFAEDVDVPDVPMIQVPQLPSQDEPLAEIKASKSPEEESKTSRMDELNDLAMLGIDADDLAAQCI